MRRKPAPCGPAAICCPCKLSVVTVPPPRISLTCNRVFRLSRTRVCPALQSPLTFSMTYSVNATGTITLEFRLQRLDLSFRDLRSRNDRFNCTSENLLAHRLQILRSANALLGEGPPRACRRRRYIPRSARTGAISDKGKCNTVPFHRRSAPCDAAAIPGSCNISAARVPPPCISPTCNPVFRLSRTGVCPASLSPWLSS